MIYQVAPASVGVVQGAYVLVRTQVHTAPSNGNSRELNIACPTHEIWVNKHDNHGDIVVEMPTNPSVNIF